MAHRLAHPDHRAVIRCPASRLRTAVLLFAAALGACAPDVVPQGPAPAACLPDLAAADALRPLGGMVALPGGRTTMGAQPMWPEEGPARQVSVAPFWIARTDVTNADFAAFVRATGYRTLAERSGSSLVFVGAQGAVNLADPGQWWRVVPGAHWRQPNGPGSTIKGRETLPVVHMAYDDALAYARWRGHDLPTEAEWEYAARGGLEGARYTWGDAPQPASQARANTWQGPFPLLDRGQDGYKAQASPVGCFAANGYGLYDMAGNVWQWTQDAFTPPGAAAGGRAPQQVIKGGSFLCADNYCFRYRPSARTGAARNDGSSHIGFRTVWREPSAP